MSPDTADAARAAAAYVATWKASDFPRAAVGVSPTMSLRREMGAPREPSAPTGCSSTANGTCGQSWASTPPITTGTARTSPASNDRLTRAAKSALHETCPSGGARCPAA
jgi:hypothetical protein